MDVIDAFLSVLPHHKKSSGGWFTFDCPACGDRRSRGGFLVTPTNGFRYHCFNAGCDFQIQPTGWEPDRGLGGRPRKLFRELGGDIKVLPIELIMRRADDYNKSGLLVTANEEQPIWRFPKEDLPRDARLITDFIDDENYLEVFEYAQSRLGPIIYEYPVMWTPTHKRCVLIPYFNFGEIVGWMTRAIDTKAFFQKTGHDYIFNQDELVGEGRAAIVVEGIFDALSLMGFAIRKSSPTKQQAILLNSCGRDIIVLPDFAKDGLGMIRAAEENNWFVSTPKWDLKIKDATQAVQHYGRLYTIRSVMEAKSKNYLGATIKARAASAKEGTKK
jgi:hypothetical protein